MTASPPFGLTGAFVPTPGLPFGRAATSAAATPAAANGAISARA